MPTYVPMCNICHHNGKSQLSDAMVALKIVSSQIGERIGLLEAFVGRKGIENAHYERPRTLDSFIHQSNIIQQLPDCLKKKTLQNTGVLYLYKDYIHNRSMSDDEN